MRNILNNAIKTCCRCTIRRVTNPVVASRTLQCQLDRQGSGGKMTGRRFRSSTTAEHIFKSLQPDEIIPEVSLPDYMFSKFDLYGNNTALINDVTGKAYKYSELEQLTKRVGSFLTRSGFKKGDVVCYFGTNNPEFTILLMGCASVGVILTTANPAYTKDELVRHMEHSNAKMVVTVVPLVEKVKDAGVQNIMVVGEADGCRPFSAALADDGTAFPQNVVINPREDVMILPYSSGTTGLPKGVMLSHHNVVANLVQFQMACVTTAEDNNFGVLPFFHIYGMAPVMLGSLQNGSPLVTTPGFDPEAFLTAIQNHKITVLHIVPPMLVFLLRHPMVSKYDLSSLRLVVCAAAPLGKGLTVEFMERFNVTVVQGYGLTETSPVISVDAAPTTIGSIGPLIPNTEAKIIDPSTGQSLNRNEEGELCVRGPQVMMGYLNNEEATRNMIDDDGWLKTGDIGYMMDNDRLVISDRLKELIKYKGLQVAPAELEDLLHKHPDVMDVAVIGIEDERAGELPRAYVVRKPNSEVSDADIIKYVENNVADYKRLRGGVEFMTEIPKSPSGKLLRRVLRAQLK